MPAIGIMIGLANAGQGGGGYPADVPYPAVTRTVLSAIRTKSQIQGGGSIGELADTVMADSPYGSTAVVYTGTTTQRSVGNSVVLSTPVDVRNGAPGFWMKPIAFFGKAGGSGLDRLNIELHSSGSPASPSANFHRLNAGNQAYFWARSLTIAKDATTAARRWQHWAAPIPTWSVAGTGADLSAITWARYILRGTASVPVLGLGDIDFTPNPRTKAAFIIGFDDNYQIPYAAAAMDAAGVPGVLYPGDLLTNVGTSGKMGWADLQDRINHGWQIASQAVYTENGTTLDAQTSAERRADIATLRDAQRSHGLSNGGFDGSWFGTMGSENDISGPDYEASFRTMRLANGGLDANPPLDHALAWPFPDPLNQQSLNGATPAWLTNTVSRLTSAMDQAVAAKSVLEVYYHNEVETAGNARDGFNAILAYAAANPTTCEIITKKQLIG